MILIIKNTPYVALRRRKVFGFYGNKQPIYYEIIKWNNIKVMCTYDNDIMDWNHSCLGIDSLEELEECLKYCNNESVFNRLKFDPIEILC